MNMEEFNSKFKKSLNDRSMEESFMRNTTFQQISNKKGGSLPASNIQGLTTNSEMKNLKKGKKDEKKDGEANSEMKNLKKGKKDEKKDGGANSEMKNLKKGKKDEKKDGGAFTTCFEGHKIYIQ